MITFILRMFFIFMAVLAVYNWVWVLAGWGNSLNMAAAVVCTLGCAAWWKLDLIQVRS